jgi:hypothetical protein
MDRIEIEGSRSRIGIRIEGQKEIGKNYCNRELRLRPRIGEERKIETKITIGDGKNDRDQRKR